MKKNVILILTFLLLSLQYRLWMGAGSIRDVVRLKNAIQAEQGGILKLAERNQRLDSDVQALKAYPEALEDRARSELGMIKEGETFCLMVEFAR